MIAAPHRGWLLLAAITVLLLLPPPSAAAAAAVTGGMRARPDDIPFIQCQVH